LHDFDWASLFSVVTAPLKQQIQENDIRMKQLMGELEKTKIELEQLKKEK